MDIAIDRTSSTPIYRQIAERIREMIRSGSLPEGFRLPPERRLATALAVNRSTVLNAYREVKADGLVDAHVGRGTVVCARPAAQPRLASGGDLLWRRLFRQSHARVSDPILRDLLALTERPDVISLSIGLPAPELLPAALLSELMSELFATAGAKLLLHCPTEGHTPLRATLSKWLASRSICCLPDEVMIISGSQQGLDLAARVFVDPGDSVVVEEPTYIGALEVFRSAGAHLITVPTDQHGMCTEELERILERYRPKLIYTLPTFQNPSGAVLSLDRRRHLLDLSYAYGIPIIEDDPYSELRYEGQALPSLRALDQRQHVLYLSTLSKVLFPGLRLGYLVGPRRVLRRFALAKQSVDLHSSSAAQWLLDLFLSRGHLEPHLSAVRAAYKERRDVMAEALDRDRSHGLEWSRPAGGFYFWCRLPDGTSCSRVLTLAADAGVSFLPGTACSADGGGEELIRLNFSYASPGDIREGVRRLISAVRAASSSPLAHPQAASMATPPIV